MKRTLAPSRRDLLCLGGLNALGVSLPQLLTLRQARGDTASPSVRAKNCILVWLDGGPSHLETFDLKPDAPR